MINMNDGAVYYGQRETAAPSEGASEFNDVIYTQSRCQTDFVDFIRSVKDDSDTFPYREQLVNNVKNHNYSLTARLDDILDWNPTLHDNLMKRPLQYIPSCERAIKEAYISLLFGPGKEDEAQNVDRRQVPDMQLLLTGGMEMAIRDLAVDRMEEIVAITGIVIQASRPVSRATSIRLQCRQCKEKMTIAIAPGKNGVPIPRMCQNQGGVQIGEAKCPLDPYMIVPDECLYQDTQSLKLQEKPEQVPTGEMPRHMTLHLARTLIDKMVPGARLRVVGVYSASERPEKKDDVGSSGSNVRSAYLHVLGVTSEEDQPGRQGILSQLEAHEEEKIKMLAASENIHERIQKSIAPAIFARQVVDGRPSPVMDVKMAIACMLFSGSRKKLPDETRIRGDINVLLLGDPGIAKSQFLKFVERAAPIAVYTSGKGSSAAGLTAAIIRDQTGNFALEGGAMVLADGGVVCIDEFDKMRNDDRVAIHEAMEQQTISIAKAGITTVLNTRCSVFAAANPMFGSYDDSKDTSEQMDFQTTILSRFDMIFLLKDERDFEQDKKLAQHIIGLHAESSAATAAADIEADIPVNDLRKYIAYARHYCSPRLTEAAAESLQNFYVEIRKKYKAEQSSKSAIPITVRQLEAVVRISESLARMELADDVTSAHVEDAMRLFSRSTLEAAKSGLVTDTMSPDEMAQVQKAEDALKQRLHVGGRASKATLVGDLSKRGYAPRVVNRALQVMIRRGDFEERSDFTIQRKA